MGSKALNSAIKYLKFSTKLEYAMNELKPFVHDLLYKIILPILYISDQEMATFSEDPREYINSQYDFLDSSLSPKAQACDLLVELCKYSSTVKKVKKNGKIVKKRGKPDYLHSFLEFVVNHLNEYKQKIGAGEPVDWRIKEALIFAIGTIKDELENAKEIYAQMEQMLENHIMGELSHPEPMMRLRACWCYGAYGGDCKFDNEDHLKTVAEGIFKNMGED